MSLKSLFMAASAAAILIGPAEALAETRTLSGTVTYRERMALPSDARVTVSLADVSLADAPAQVLGETVIDPAGRQVPIPYQISYDDSALRPNHSYVLQAKITIGEQLLFINTTRHAVFAEGPDATDIVVNRVGGEPAPPGPRGRWLAEDIGGKGVLDRIESVLDITSDDLVAGNGGCNRMTGKFTFEGKAIRISDLASTRRACVPAVGDQETRFFAALMAARQWQRDDLRGKLRLLDDKGRVLAVFTRM